ncbi:CPBP family intramembrane glutamic endopeptidase [Paenibacillus flagellatus]|nr:CPBP family intramembrane glutamic endopeptidase [Paenibacillus flagellatus]
MIVSHLVAAIVLIAMPIRSIYDTRALRAPSSPYRKAYTYIGVSLILWALTAAVWLEYGLADTWRYGGGSLPIGASRLLVGVVLVYFAAQILLPLALGLHADFRSAMKQSYASRSFVLPVTRAETWLYAWTAITVGICEEVLFRAFLPAYLQAAPYGLGYGTAFLAAAVLFGLSHFLQGVSGIVQTFVAAILFGYLYYATGSLLVPVVIHALYDLRIIAIARIVTRHADDIKSPS